MTQPASGAAPTPANEAERLASLRSYGILDTPPAVGFDRLALLASDIFEAPIALINLIDEGRQWAKACFGVDQREADRRISFCAHAILTPNLLVVPDTLRDPRFLDNPMVTEEPHLRFYAGAPLVMPDGQALGTLCIADVRPRPPLNEAEASRLRALADAVVDELTLWKTARDLEVARRVAEEANRSRETFFSTVNHELRTPLTSILLIAENLEGEVLGPLSEMQRRYAHELTRAGQHLLDLVNDLLDLSRLDAGRLELELQDLDLAAVLLEARDMLRDRAERKRIRLDTELLPLPPVRADRRRLKQAVLNLLANAVKFTPEDGRVLLAAAVDGDEVQVKVTDTGSGIGPEDASRLFQPFVQLHRQAGNAEGTGLGLAITRRLVELHGGKVTLTSAPGAGSTFTISLPTGASDVARS